MSPAQGHQHAVGTPLQQAPAGGMTTAWGAYLLADSIVQLVCAHALSNEVAEHLVKAL